MANLTDPPTPSKPENSSNGPSWDAAKRIAAGSRCLIFIVIDGSTQCRSMHALLEQSDQMGPLARKQFKLGWQLYMEQYAAAGGVFGILIHAAMKTQPPIIATGDADQAAAVTRLLSARAHQINQGKGATPILFDRVFEKEVLGVVAELSATEGSG